MAVISINFTKILAERNKESKQTKVDVSNNVRLTSVDKASIGIKSEGQESLKFEFEFLAEYTPSYGKIMLSGELFLIEDKKIAEEALKSWKSKKQVPENILAPLLNNILNKCNIEALILSREVSLPSPIPLPKVKENKK